MPELPELEVTKDRLRLTLVGRAVVGATVRSPVALKTVTPPLEALAGKHIRSVSRPGKVICIEVEDRLHLCIHLMLSGRFAFGPTRAPLNRLHAFALRLDHDEDLRVIEDSTRHRLSVHLVTDPQRIDIVARLGPDPLGPTFTLARLRQSLGRRNRTLKKFLTDQTAVAGIGNCFSDEILFEARLRPSHSRSQSSPRRQSASSRQPRRCCRTRSSVSARWAACPSAGTARSFGFTVGSTSPVRPARRR